jgi:hypothetical protein
MGKLNGETIYIHYVSKFLEYVLVSRHEDGSELFKASVGELLGVREQELYHLLREQELKEQEKRGI